jgi:hypothetical protein
VEFTGQLDTVLIDNGNTRYSGVPVGTTFSGSVEYGTENQATLIEQNPGESIFEFPFNAFITDGTTLTSSNDRTVIEIVNDGGVEIAEDAALINSLLGTNLMVGDPLDLIVITGDSELPNGNIVLFGVFTLSLDASAFNNTDFSNFPQDPETIDLAAFVIEETDDQENVLFLAAGVIDLDDLGSGRVPHPVPDIFTVLEGNSLSGNLTSNDDLGDGLGSVALETPASNGTLVLNSDGNFTYAPDGPGTDTFSYSLTDADGDASSPARVTITTAPDPSLAIIVNIDAGGDFAQQLDDAISLANGGNRVVRVRFQPGSYQYSSTAKSVLATPVTGRVVVEAQGGPVIISGMGPGGGLWLQISQGTLEVKSLTIQNFGSGLGGALLALDGGTLKVSDSTLAGIGWRYSQSQ